MKTYFDHDAGEAEGTIEDLIAAFKEDPYATGDIFLSATPEGGELFWDNTVYSLDTGEIEQLAAAFPDVSFQVVDPSDRRLDDSIATVMANVAIAEARDKTGYVLFKDLTPEQKTLVKNKWGDLTRDTYQYHFGDKTIKRKSITRAV